MFPPPIISPSDSTSHDKVIYKWDNSFDAGRYENKNYRSSTPSSESNDHQVSLADICLPSPTYCTFSATNIRKKQSSSKSKIPTKTKTNNNTEIDNFGMTRGI